ncbi:MAG: thioesterase domain-containing protein [Campylobacterales bacterium]|nr:thioesterase domain-containing protein [Campylobacterales bacterium]
MNIDIKEIEKFIKNNIALAEHLDFKIFEYSKTKLILNASLKANKNHHNSAFGGSLSALSILSAWALLDIKLKELNIPNDLVIQESSYKYLKPVLGDFEIIASIEEEIIFNKFINILNKKNKSRIFVKSEIIFNNELCGIHQGSYVAFKI